MPLAEAAQNCSSGNYSWKTRIKCDFNRKSFCKIGTGKMEKWAKMISVIIFSFLLVGGRRTLCTFAPQLRTSPVLFLIIKESWLLRGPWRERTRGSFARLHSTSHSQNIIDNSGPKKEPWAPQTDTAAWSVCALPQQVLNLVNSFFIYMIKIKNTFTTSHILISDNQLKN